MKTLGDARLKRPVIIWFHLCEMSRVEKLFMMEMRFLARGEGRKEGVEDVSLNSYGVCFGVVELFCMR